MAVIGIFLIIIVFKPDFFGKKMMQPEQQKVSIDMSAEKSVMESPVQKIVIQNKNNAKESTPWDDMLTTKELLPNSNDGWKKYGCDTFVPKTDDLLASASAPSRISAMFPNSNKSVKSWDIRGSVQVPIDSGVQNSMLLAKPDGYGTPYEDRRRVDIV